MKKTTVSGINPPVFKFSLSRKSILKIVLSLALIIGLVSRVNISESVLVLKQIDLKLYLFALFLGFNSTIIASYRCKYVCKKKIDVAIPLLKCYQYYFYSNFYSNFLPTAIGGDIFRIYHLNHHIKNLSNSSSVVLFERISGFFSLLLMSVIASIILFFNFDRQDFLFNVLLIAFMSIFGLFLLLNRKFESKLINLIPKLGFPFVLDYIQKVNENIRQFIKDTEVAKNTLIQSASFQLFSVIVIYIYGSSLGINVSIIFYFVMIPITYFVTMLPISFAGIGLREVTIVSLFSLVEVQSHIAITLSFLIYMEILLKGITGGIFLFLSNMRSLKLNNFI